MCVSKGTSVITGGASHNPGRADAFGKRETKWGHLDSGSASSSWTCGGSSGR
jgi:hypothetical protein